MLASFYLMLNLPAATWMRFAIWLVIGLVVYGLYGARRSRVGLAAADCRAGRPDVIDLRDAPGDAATRVDRPASGAAAPALTTSGAVRPARSGTGRTSLGSQQVRRNRAEGADAEAQRVDRDALVDAVEHAGEVQFGGQAQRREAVADDARPR